MTATAPQIPTISGTITPDQLGAVLMHEHVLLAQPDVTVAFPGIFDPEVRVPDARRQLRELKDLGIDTIVDMTVLGMGRDIDLVRRASDGTGLNVLAATGFFTLDELPVFFQRRGPGTLFGGSDPLEELFVRELESGIAETGVRAVVIKCATGERGLTHDVDRVLRSAAAAHQRTGAVISTHADPATQRGIDQQRVLREEGVELDRVVIGHCGDSTDLDYLTTIMDAGSSVGMDRFGMDNLLPTAERVRVVAELVRRGYASRILLSHDTNCFTANWDPEARERMIPDWRLSFIPTRVLGLLRDAGVGDEDIDRMMRANPARLLTSTKERS
ncbi:MAG TPA: phosphotriesterase-related protein [Pseudolysinimonas sp.]|jgi:phosphotriesterase-related protein